MKMDCINSIDIYSNNKDVFTITSDSYENFYIANIDDNGDEINYLLCEDQITLFANFFITMTTVTRHWSKPTAVLQQRRVHRISTRHIPA